MTSACTSITRKPGNEIDGFPSLGHPAGSRTLRLTARDKGYEPQVMLGSHERLFVGSMLRSFISKFVSLGAL